MVKNTDDKKKTKGYKTIKVLKRNNKAIYNSLELIIEDVNGELSTYEMPIQAISTKNPSTKRAKYKLVSQSKGNWKLVRPSDNILYAERLENNMVSVTNGRNIVSGMVVKATPVCKNPGGKPAPPQPSPKPVPPKPAIITTDN